MRPLPEGRDQVRLYGLLVMEALDQLAFAYTDPEPVFEACPEGPRWVCQAGTFATPSGRNRLPRTFSL